MQEQRIPPVNQRKPKVIYGWKVHIPAGEGKANQICVVATDAAGVTQLAPDAFLIERIGEAAVSPEIFGVPPDQR